MGTYVRSTTLLSLLCALLVGCCNSEEGAARARGLSQDELSGLYTLTERAYRTERVRGLLQGPMPPVLGKLQPEGVVGSHTTVAFHLSGCVDDKSYLRVEGLGRPAAEHKIVLAPGERIDSELLWPRPR